ncbi:hypothetical protein OP10G_1800 [Fimbriimonas ginsengisoli Gsoil 348]|uniref:Uncharacterized protein n=1 Tax=Fimbriimonas ginsengisoli Gsoil 348 TaxID=661478 RepID=A0A068NNN6_FIMGI|nr:hypothetical protein OP10G_1800 [Fimbriimonas ginsengisoli Gsoil 348]
MVPFAEMTSCENPGAARNSKAHCTRQPYSSSINPASPESGS